jgi:hypothetical protein
VKDALMKASPLYMVWFFSKKLFARAVKDKRNVMQDKDV